MNNASDILLVPVPVPHPVNPCYTQLFESVKFLPLAFISLPIRPVTTPNHLHYRYNPNRHTKQ
ncbi:hypothetical protein E2C01_093805 [Portunus trituberculatus]|uniref:Uncharacterized protein n=1 Tax=Portunus trituberculatus TaxID=210409 RepID=A0A5B7K1D0_PORTR|nr:hypothetical protein [Portunus trituberculatus]